MNLHRQGENSSVPFRVGRFFNIESNWYFARRNAADSEPYESKSDAALLLYVRDIHTLNVRLAIQI